MVWCIQLCSAFSRVNRPDLALGRSVGRSFDLALTSLFVFVRPHLGARMDGAVFTFSFGLAISGGVLVLGLAPQGVLCCCALMV